MKSIGEVTIVKRNTETGEVFEHTEYNTQLNAMLRNLTLVSSPHISASNTVSMIYISDNINVLTRQSNDVQTTNQTYSLGGAVIAGEFWPQYSLDTVNERAVFTFKQRFPPPAAGSRTINTIALYSPPMSASIAALNLQTPCIQSSLEILDIFYKIYVNYDPAQIGDNNNVNMERAIANNTLSRWFSSGNGLIYAEGTSTALNGSAQWSDGMSALPANSDLRIYTSGPLDTNTWYGSTLMGFVNLAYTATSNPTQGTVLRAAALTTTQGVGVLINKLGVPRLDMAVANYVAPMSASPVLGPADSKIQSVYLKSASSAATNFAYLDPSTIGSSTATLVLNDADWVDPEIPLMFKLSITTGGNISTATYKISIRNTFGFNNNFFDNERSFSLNTIFRRYGSTVPTHISNTYNARYFNVIRVDDKHFVTCSLTGITVTNAYTQDFKNYSATSTPALNSSTIQSTVAMPDGAILVVTTDNGLLKLSADRTTVTKFTGIGSGVNDNVCYAAAVKHNGDIWAMFEGALAKYSASGGTWTIYNSSTPITFIHSEYNPTWNNTLAIFCRKDAGGDEVLLARNNSTALTWWSPTASTPVNTTATGNTGINKYGNNIRADSTKICISLPGTSAWFIQNANGTISRMTFGTNTATVVSSTTLSNYRPAVFKERMYNGSWIIYSIENPQTASTGIRARGYNASSLVFDDTAQNALMNPGSAIYHTELLDDFGTGVGLNTQGSTFAWNVWVTNAVNPLGVSTWMNYGWNSGTSQWELDNPNSKPVHSTVANLPMGLKCYFTPTGTNDFITNERWIGYVFDGLHKDNSTTAVLNNAIQARNSYITTDLSASTVPASAYGSTTENVSMYTLTDDRFSWNGGVSQAGSASNTVALSQRSELWVPGDFTYNFYTGQFAGSASTTATVCYMSMYERDAVTPTSKWAFQFRNDGYVVAEDEVARTTRVAVPGANTKFTIKRVGSTITYLVNDVLVWTSATTSSNPLRFMVRMPQTDPSRVFYDMKVTYTEGRRVIKIGDAVDQTGVYDPDYAMIEAWLATPRTTKVTIDGVAATVLTDPMVTPAAGQVQLLQKSGMLVFNSADAGKPVTCEAMVLLET